MDLGYWSLLSMGLMSAAARDLGHRVVQVTEAARFRLPSRAAAAVLASVGAAWLINAMERGHGDLRFLVALSLGSLVAAFALALGWTSKPEELERWAARALVAAVASTLPALIRV